jgi:YVTN family beta-propeller protein
MKTRTLRFLFAALSGSLLFASCKKEDKPVIVIPETPIDGLLVLNEGSFFGNNTMLTYYDAATKTATTDYYRNKNGHGLGDTGNDFIKYGTKLYFVVNVSSYVQVTNSAGTDIKKIDFLGVGGVKREPRYIVPYKNKVLVSSYDGTVAVIDTTSLTIDKFITVGSNPEQMAVAGDKLFVANSGGFSYPVFDSTISVVDLASYTEVHKVKVGKNPGAVVADNAGNVYVGCTGNYSTVGPTLVKINAFTHAIIKTVDFPVGKMRFYNGYIYATPGYIGDGKVKKIDPNTLAAVSSNFITDGTAVTSPYGLDLDTETGDVYISDNKNSTVSGEVFCFDKDGKKKFSFATTPGLNPNKVVIVRK